MCRPLRLDDRDRAVKLESVIDASSSSVALAQLALMVMRADAVPADKIPLVELDGLSLSVERTSGDE